MLTDIKSQTREEVQSQFEDWRQPEYRVGQLLEWLYLHRVTDWDAMTNLPKALREQLRRNYSLHTLEMLRRQGSRDQARRPAARRADDGHRHTRPGEGRPDGRRVQKVAGRPAPSVIASH